MLTDHEIKQFIESGFVRLKSAIPEAVLLEWRQRAFDRLRYDPHDRATWKATRVHLPATRSIPLHELSPTLHGAICQLVGGVHRIDMPHVYDSFIINLRDHDGVAWNPPRQQLGWHVDGNNFRHFLDSPELGLVCLINWSTVDAYGGGTFFALDSLPVVARLLLERPEGLLPEEIDAPALLPQCFAFAEGTCDAGDAMLLHPFLLHTASQNHSAVPRFLTNSSIAFHEPLKLDAACSASRSPVEAAILRALGCTSVDFSPQRPRQVFIPERTRVARDMLAAERAHAGTAASSPISRLAPADETPP